jgi:REP element-mobilizing transposase RayT
MPNHVHVLFLPLPGEELAKVLQEWKSISSRRIQAAMGGSGSLWMPDYWDTLIRSPEHYWKVRNYILRNPVEAKLPSSHHVLWAREKPLWEDLKKEGFVVKAMWG